MPSPRVSIITSTYNRAQMLRRAIESVRAQTFADWEHIIVGDCTPDDTEAVVRSFNDPRLRFFNLPEKSPPGSHGAIAKNHGIRQMARGEYIAYLDDDDRYRPRFLEVMMGYLQAHPETVLAYCRSMYRHKNSGKRLWGNPFQRWLHGYSKQKLRRYNFLNTNCVIHRKSVVDEVGGWDPAYYFDDYELWLRISEKHDFHHVNRVLIETYVEESPFLVRAFRKGWKILRHGRTTPVK
ncbi:MAG: glycosyltransferase [Verrucomicrobia bacterium]|nr:glycosyltransferase [Verrucomicrobiota bacterium]MBU1909698.1 glycosyltransferase [Verrucomicrobiota bacterium]